MVAKFAFAGGSIQNDTDLDKVLAETSKESRFFRPGKHDVVIKRVTDKGPMKNDPTWTNLRVELEGTGEKVISLWLAIPTTSPLYGEKQSALFFARVKEFCAALGEDLKVATWAPVLTKLFAHPEKLAGQALTIDVGYTRAHPEFVGKTDSGVRFNLRMKDGSLYQENGGPKAFDAATSKEASLAVEKFCVESRIDFEAFAQVTRCYPSTTAATADAGW